MIRNSSIKARIGKVMIVIVLLIAITPLLWNWWQFRDASRLFTALRTMPLNVPLSHDAIELLKHNWCGTREVSDISSELGAHDFYFDCREFHISTAGLRRRDLIVEVVMIGQTIEDKRTFLALDRTNVIGVHQTHRGYGYVGALDPEAPNHGFEHSKWMDGTDKFRILWDDDTIPESKRQTDWTLETDCLRNMYCDPDASFPK